jgi:hypothetical protein
LDHSFDDVFSAQLLMGLVAEAREDDQLFIRSGRGRKEVSRRRRRHDRVGVALYNQ